MTARYRLTRHPSRQIRVVALYSATTRGKARGRRYVEELRARLDRLAGSPGVGRLRDDLSAGLRGFPHERHMIHCRETDAGIEVVAVLHQAQDGALPDPGQQ